MSYAPDWYGLSGLDSARRDDLDRGRTAPGKTTLTQRLPPSSQAIARAITDGFGDGFGAGAAAPGAVAQLRRAGESRMGDDVLDVAAQGVAGSGHPLPHLAEVQRAFGRHDVSGVRAHTGADASAASERLDAEAYAMGDAVAFRATPDLHTVAHEAAHVVQQRGGVSLKGSVGEAGDEYERHADAVADLVVRGQSAESLLDAHAPAGAGAGVQRRQLQLLTRAHGAEAVRLYERLRDEASPEERAALERALEQSYTYQREMSFVRVDATVGGEEYQLTLPTADAERLRGGAAPDRAAPAPDRAAPAPDRAAPAPDRAAPAPASGDRGRTPASGPDAAPARDDEFSSMSLADCRTRVRDMYIGEGSYAERGILTYKLQAIQLMDGRIRAEDPPSLASRALRSACMIGIAAGAATLGAIGVEAGAPILATALSAGGGETLMELLNYLGDTPTQVNVGDFISRMLTSTREGWPRSVRQLLDSMTTEEVARGVARSVKAMRDDHAAIERIQSREVLDEWANAVNYDSGGRGTGAREGMGTETYFATDGRIYLSGAELTGDDVRFVQPTHVQIDGLNQELRNMYRDRQVGQVQTAMTMSILIHNAALETRNLVMVGKSPTGTYSIEGGSGFREDLTDRRRQPTSVAHTWLASFALSRNLDANDWGPLEGDHDQALIDANWERGLAMVWERIASRTLGQLGLGSG